MKKYIFAVLSVCLLLFALAGCGKSDAVKNTEKLIKGIGVVTVDSKVYIEAAEKAYSKLSDEDKVDVKNYEKLLEARAVYDDIIDFNAKLAGLLKKIEKNFIEYGIKSAEITSLYDELSERYKAMDKQKKAQVKDYDKLEAAISEFNKVSEELTEPAAAYVKAFYKLNEGKNYTVEDVGCILQERNGKKYRLFALKYKDEAENNVCVYSSARFTDIPPIETIVKRADNFFAPAPISEKMDALKNRNVKIDINAVLEAAK